MATHSSTLAWKIPWVEEPGGLQSLGSLTLDTTEWLHFHFSLSCIGEGNGSPLQCSCLENPRTGEPGGLPSMGSHRVGHDWSNLAAAAATEELNNENQLRFLSAFSKVDRVRFMEASIWITQTQMLLILNCHFDTRHKMLYITLFPTAFYSSIFWSLGGSQAVFQSPKAKRCTRIDVLFGDSSFLKYGFYPRVISSVKL